MQRRDFLKYVGASAGAIGLAGLAGRAKAQDMTMTPATGVSDAEAIDAAHQAGVQTFLDNAGKDPLFWNRVLEPEMDGDVKVFNITCEEIDWETAPGMTFQAMAYNQMVPGPEIRATEDDTIRINFTNNMTSQSTAIHFHGLRIPNGMDGVPFITQPSIKPGETFSYEFKLKIGNAGSHMYHSHLNAAEQTTGGMLGAFIIEPKDKSREPVVNAEYTLILNDSTLGFTVNGKSFPYTQPIVANRGDKIRIRYMNEGLMIHPFHLHGIPQLVISKDGNPLPVPYLVDTINIAPGERYDVIVDCDEPGYWAFHCHILTHAESREGMFGMVTVLIVNE